MVVHIDVTSFIYGDHMSHPNNSGELKSTLKKESISIWYHAMQEAVSMDKWLVAHIPSRRMLMTSYQGSDMHCKKESFGPVVVVLY